MTKGKREKKGGKRGGRFHYYTFLRARGGKGRGKKNKSAWLLFLLFINRRKNREKRKGGREEKIL